MKPIQNIAAYRFASLENLKELRAELLAYCKEAGLKGTILLSTEGINLFIAGAAAGIEGLMARLHAIPGLEGLTPKSSDSDHQPFTRMLVRIKKEIIAFGVPGIDPARRTSPKLPAKQLKQWLDEKRPITLLDTRNDYEVKLGTFENAVTLDLDTFRNFPAAVATLPEELKTRPIVMFCTGGIRCEKAGPYMEQVGFQDILQLDGGILKYFEECGGDHYQGECFVFDQRVGVDPALAETDNTQCFVCQAPLTADEQQDVRYVPGVSCPHCYLTPEEHQAKTLARREAQIARIAADPAIRRPYDNVRPFSIPARFDHATLREVVAGMFPHVPESDWQERIERGLLVDPTGAPADLNRVVRAGEMYRRLIPDEVEPEVNLNIRLIHEDDSLVVVNKPAPLPVHPCGRYNRNTLQAVLNQVYAPQKLRPAHRLDANTTGVLVLSRSRAAAGRVQPQFERGEVEKVYLARVHGHPAEDGFSCSAAIGTEAREAGGRSLDEQGLSSHTDFRVLNRLPDGTALLEVRPTTGRTNQIRLHLWSLGFPIVGDATYLPGGLMGTMQTHGLDAAPMCLHALSLAMTHPTTGERMVLIAPTPEWAEKDVRSSR